MARLRSRVLPTPLAALLAVVGVVLFGLGALAGVADASGSAAQASSHRTSGTAGTTGNPASPQPLSTADTTSGGANGHCTGGTYCSTRDGTASANGGGNGKATGKPCAGCVGRADNKNPPGQETASPRAVFPNNGYECDNNNGIGKTNPAHTGCAGPSTSGSDCVTNPPVGGCSPSPGCTTDCSPSPGCVSSCSPSGGGAVVLGETAMKVPTTTVLGERVPQAPPAAVAGRRVTQTPLGLPFTGAVVVTLIWVGAATAITGLGLLLAAAYRRRSLIG